MNPALRVRTRLLLSVSSVCSVGRTAGLITNSIGLKLMSLQAGTFKMDVTKGVYYGPNLAPSDAQQSNLS
jgi:hypothetical protein